MNGRKLRYTRVRVTVHKNGTWKKSVCTKRVTLLGHFWREPKQLVQKHEPRKMRVQKMLVLGDKNL